MRNSRSTDPPFRLKQENCAGPAQFRVQRTAVLEAWPTGQGDYFLAGRDTYPFRAKISAVGGRWDGQAKKWFVTRDQALRLGAAVLCRVLRAPACCEKHIDAMVEGGAEAMATRAEVMAERMTVTFCTICDSRIHEVVAIRDILEPEELPLGISAKAPWRD